MFGLLINLRKNVLVFSVASVIIEQQKILRNPEPGKLGGKKGSEEAS
jgi:hypothetical protein